MNTRALSIALLVLTMLVGVLYWSNHHKPKEDDSIKVSSEASPKIISLNATDIAAMRIARKDQPEVALSRNASGAWQIIAPGPIRADQDAVSSMLSTVSSLSAERLVDEKASNLEPYGLKNPALELDVTTKDSKTQKLLVGDSTPAGTAYYAVLAGDPRLFTLAAYNKTSLDKSVNDLRDKRLLIADFDKVSQIELLNDKKQDLTFARDKDAWQILKPRPYRADNTQVDDLIRTLREARFETSSDQDNAKLAAAFKSAKPVATAKITDASGTQELELRKDKDSTLAKSSIASGIFKVPPTLGTALDKTLEEFRNKKLFDFGYSDLTKIEFRDGPKSRFLTHSGADWWGADGKKLDQASVESFIGSLRDLAAVKFPESGFTAPALEINVSSQDGKRVERISIAKAGEGYIARRENEPVFYELSAASVSELEKAAEGLAPATPAKK